MVHKLFIVSVWFKDVSLYNEIYLLLFLYVLCEGSQILVALVPGPCKKCKLLFYRHVTSNSEAACAGRTELPVEQDQGSFSVCV